MRPLPSLPIDTLIKEGDIENLREALNTPTPFEIAVLITNEGDATNWGNEATQYPYFSPPFLL